MKKEDFIFDKTIEFDDGCDYWFCATGRSKELLTEKYMDDKVIDISEVVYSTRYNEVAIKKQLEHTFSIQIVENRELHDILRSLISKL